MGTPSMIGILNEDGSVTASYCHYDGYLSYNGRVLVDHYNTTEKARTVAEVGYLSSLSNDLSKDIEEAVHKNEKPVVYDSVAVYMKCGYNHAGAEYLYIFDGEAWFYAERYGRKTFEEVEMNLSTVL
jgi:hypothetical protein